MVKVTEKRKLFDGLCVIQCMQCGEILATAAELDELPEYCMCDCDEKVDDS